jgi:hypothetical protein
MATNLHSYTLQLPAPALVATSVWCLAAATATTARLPSPATKRGKICNRTEAATNRDNVIWLVPLNRNQGMQETPIRLASKITIRVGKTQLLSYGSWSHAMLWHCKCHTCGSNVLNQQV